MDFKKSTWQVFFQDLKIEDTLKPCPLLLIQPHHHLYHQPHHQPIYNNTILLSFLKRKNSNCLQLEAAEVIIFEFA